MSEGPSSPASGVIFTAAEAYFGAASQQLHQAFPDASIERLGPETGCIAVVAGGDGATSEAPTPALVGDGGVASEAPAPALIASACRRVPLPFIRHLAAETATCPVDRPGDIGPLAIELLARAGLDDVALQVWTDGTRAVRAESLRAGLVASLADAGISTLRGGRPSVLTVCVTAVHISGGVTSRDDALADWPGGRIPLARSAAQVSQAEFKLEELFKVAPSIWPAGGGRALDLGASPGGWTRVLRLKGFEVWAVDPGDLHPSIAADRGVHHITETAGRFLSHPLHEETEFDLVVNDMRMVPERSCEVMIDAATHLAPGALAIVTLKLSPHRAASTVERALRTLAPAYDVVFARQLFHNKNEVTVAARRRGD